MFDEYPYSRAVHKAIKSDFLISKCFSCLKNVLQDQRGGKSVFSSIN